MRSSLWNRQYPSYTNIGLHILENLFLFFQTYNEENAWINLYIFLKACPHPQTSVIPRLFKQKCMLVFVFASISNLDHFLRSRSRSKLAHAYEALWLEFMRCKVFISLTQLVNYRFHGKYYCARCHIFLITFYNFWKNPIRLQTSFSRWAESNFCLSRLFRCLTWAHLFLFWHLKLFLGWSLITICKPF